MKRVEVKKDLQLRAENMKSLTEQRTAAVQEMKDLTEKAEKEERAMSEEEDAAFDKLDSSIKALDSTIAKLERARDLTLDADSNQTDEGATLKEKEERAFENYIRSESGAPELITRAGEQNLTMGNNGAVIPTTIADRIITAVKDICPILEKATMYNVKGTLKVPVWGTANTHGINVGYQEEFTDIIADSGKFTSVDLSGYLAGALTLIGKSVANNAQVDVVSFVIQEMSKEIAAFLEKELLTGTSKATGALSTTTVLKATASATITADELITLQSKIKQVYQKDACWTMHPDTFTAIRKLKDGNGRYLIQDDFTGEFPYRLLGKPVFESDSMPKMEAGKKAILYGDYSGLSINMREGVQVQVLLEKYVTQHAIGIISWFEFDSKVTDHSKLTTLEMAA